MKRINIVLFGLSLQCANKGCEALAYSFFSLLNQTLKERGKYANVDSVIYLPKGEEISRDMSRFDRIEHRFLPNRKKEPSAQLAIIKAIRQCDVCFDFTEGDSFSDLYGKSRFYWRTAEKIVVLLAGKKLILGPQTFGPFRSAMTNRLACWVVSKAWKVYTRDIPSAALIREMTGREAEVATDLAFGLPSERIVLPETKKVRIGINISALLWHSHRSDNRFFLKTDYPDYIIRLIRSCLKRKDWQVWLIPHVIMDPANEDPENDHRLCRSLCEAYPGCVALPECKSPMEVKAYISQMDAFTGARMHACVAAVSSGVSTLPFAYSKKAGDLFSSLGYPYILDGRAVTTEDAVKRTLEFFESAAEAGCRACECKEQILGKTSVFTRCLEEVISDQ